MFETKEKLLLIPYFWDQNLLNKIRKESLSVHKVYLSEHIMLNEFSIITGFIGYPQILTLLNSIKNIFEKEIFFLGTAGAIMDSIKVPFSLNITEVYSSSILKHFSKEKMFPLRQIHGNPIRNGKCVSIDIPSRETMIWLKQQKEKKIDAVEMELFPIRVFLQKSFTAVVIITDLVKGDLKIKLMNKKLIKKEFIESFHILEKNIKILK